MLSTFSIVVNFWATFFHWNPHILIATKKKKTNLSSPKTKIELNAAVKYEEKYKNSEYTRHMCSKQTWASFSNFYWNINSNWKYTHEAHIYRETVNTHSKCSTKEKMIVIHMSEKDINKNGKNAGVFHIEYRYTFRGMKKKIVMCTF